MVFHPLSPAARPGRVRSGSGDAFVQALRTPLSAPGLERYRTNDGPNLHMLANYFWNMDLAETLFPSLPAVEVGLHNTIHATLSNRYGTQQWWHQPYVLGPKQHDAIVGIDVANQNEYSPPSTLARLVASRNGGVWTTILSHPNEPKLWRYKRFILVDRAFLFRAGTTLHDIHQRFNDVRILRNRVMHHEPIFDRPSLVQEHAHLQGALNWISPELHQGIHIVDDFLVVHQHDWADAATSCTECSGNRRQSAPPTGPARPAGPPFIPVSPVPDRWPG